MFIKLKQTTFVYVYRIYAECCMSNYTKPNATFAYLHTQTNEQTKYLLKCFCFATVATFVSFWKTLH